MDTGFWSSEPDRPPAKVLTKLSVTASNFVERQGSDCKFNIVGMDVGGVISLGTSIYREFDVNFDQDNMMLGFRP